MESITRAASCLAGLLLVGILVLPAGAETLDEREWALRMQLERLLPGHPPDRISQSPIPGVYEVLYGSEVWYVPEGGQHILKGELFDLRTRANLTENVRQVERARLLQDYGKEKLLVYPSSGKPRYILTVVTDIDCVFCRKLHSHIDQLGEMGIEVNYLFNPRAGVDSDSYQKAVSVWCAADPLDALTRAKREEKIETRECANPVAEHMQVVAALGASSTPTIYRQDGVMIRGYLPPEKLLAALSD